MKTIALLTDFGTRDYFVGAMKGAILSVCESAQIIDITHDVEPQNIASARFTLRACYADFPPETVFVAVVDPGVGSTRRAILVEADNRFFVAPDNGLLSFLFNKGENRSVGAGVKNSVRVFELTNQKYFARAVSRTFHGRDVFAPVAANLANGVAPHEFGAEILDFVRVEESRPHRVSEKIVEGEIIHADCFGNLITNFRLEDLPAKFYLKIAGGRKIAKLQTFFAEAEAGEIFMIFGSAGFLEIAAFGASARALLKAKTGEKIFAVTLN